VRRFRLGEEEAADLTASTTAAERLAMMWRLALDAWASSGLPIPTYRREETLVHRIPPASADGG